MSDLETKFKAAAEEVNKLTTKPNNEELLSLYAHFKQATKGQDRGERPGFMDFKARAKYDAWAALGTMTSKEAMEKYIEIVEDLKKKYPINAST
ncbi:hypothetical protein H4219_004558 [Mycoemilia scoparia]|uniref:ACB domain-containing protein n=1 Tax=Mycoemilia scoparia TaxID=417184 RepID=A0A9W8A0T8_9FUNG|nr:hypothetical protein H4219_004558 [Mycoemilia scoparia]